MPHRSGKSLRRSYTHPALRTGCILSVVMQRPESLVAPSRDVVPPHAPAISSSIRPRGGALWAGASVALDDRTALMSRYSIGFDGRRYDFEGYHYDRLADAVAYARLERSRDPPSAPLIASMAVRDEPPRKPDAAEEQVMAEFGISFTAGFYEFAGFRYEHLAAAADYARLIEAAHASAG